MDTTTGSIHLRGTFENPQNRLWPGLYVGVLLTLSQQPNATVVPAHSIVTTQQGSYVYVVKTNNTVEQRTVVSNRTIENDAVVEKGLQPGEVVVTDGQVNLVPNAKIELKNRDAELLVEPAGRPNQQAGSTARQSTTADPPLGKPNRPKAQ